MELYEQCFSKDEVKTMLDPVVDKLKAENIKNVICLLIVYEHCNCDLEQVLAFYDFDNKDISRRAIHYIYGTSHRYFSDRLNLDDIKAYFESKAFNIKVINAL